MTAHPATTGPRAALAGERLLPFAIRLDAVASGAMGVLLLAGGALLDGPFSIPLAVLMPVGAALIAWAAALLAVARRQPVSATAAKEIVALNVVWVAASVAVLVGDWLSPSGLGTAFVIVQAAAVLGFAELQITGLRRGGAR